MFSRVVAGSLLCLSLLSGPVAAGEGHHTVRAPWHQQHPWIGTGVGFYYSQHPDHIPAYPKRLSGYAVPIFETMKPVACADVQRACRMVRDALPLLRRAIGHVSDL
jgi:hypothetical protein